MMKLLFEHGILKRPWTCPSCGKHFEMHVSGTYGRYTGLMRCGGSNCVAKFSVLRDHPILLRQG
eukprot:5301591-Amphidinium_carterae.1